MSSNTRTKTERSASAWSFATAFACWSMLNRTDRDGIRAALRSASRRNRSSRNFSSKKESGVRPPVSRFSRSSASIFRRCDFPDPKKPEIQTPFPLFPSL